MQITFERDTDGSQLELLADSYAGMFFASFQQFASAQSKKRSRMIFSENSKCK